MIGGFMSFKITTLMLPAAALTVFIAAPVTVGAQARMRFAAMDTNGDGVISRTEWRGNDRSFINHDWNGDGQLSGAEVRVGAQRNTNWEEADHVPNRYERYVSWTQAGFDNLDHNRDGRIAANEWHYDTETFRRVDRNRDGSLDQTEFLGVDVDDARDDNFDDLDWNNNGRVERSEWYGSESVFSSMDRNRDGVLSRFEVVGGIDTPNDTWDQFVSLDYNRNGSLSRDEWHWSARSFATRDTNRDGMLSRQEFAAAGGSPDAVGTAGSQQGRSVQVMPQQRWTDSGINVRAGDVLTLDASGTMQLSDDANDTATPAGSRTNRRAPDAPVLNQSAGGLLARIDNYGPIFLGGRRTFTVPVSGRLYFGVNDDHLADNRGEFVVNVSVGSR
jgi:Ca2+-binding EF-hand superfamily protein